MFPSFQCCRFTLEPNYSSYNIFRWRARTMALFIRTHQVNRDTPLMTEHVSLWKPKNSSTNQSYVAQKRRSTNFEALKLRNARSGSAHSTNCCFCFPPYCSWLHLFQIAAWQQAHKSQAILACCCCCNCHRSFRLFFPPSPSFGLNVCFFGWNNIESDIKSIWVPHCQYVCVYI